MPSPCPALAMIYTRISEPLNPGCTHTSCGHPAPLPCSAVPGPSRCSCDISECESCTGRLGISPLSAAHKGFGQVQEQLPLHGAPILFLLPIPAGIAAPMTQEEPNTPCPQQHPHSALHNLWIFPCHDITFPLTLQQRHLCHRSREMSLQSRHRDRADRGHQTWDELQACLTPQDHNTRQHSPRGCLQKPAWDSVTSLGLCHQPTTDVLENSGGKQTRSPTIPRFQSLLRVRL